MSPRTGADGQAAAAADPQKEAAILDAARRLFLHYGFKKTSVEDIAREAGIAKGTVYLYFGSKQEILARLGVAYLTESKARLEERLTKEDDPRVKLHLVLRLRAEEIFKFVQAHPHALDLLLNLSPEEGERVGAAQFYREYMQLLGQVLQEGIAQGIFAAPENLEAYVYQICFMSQAFQPPYKLVSSLDDLLPMVDGYAQTVIAALRPTPTDTPPEN